MRFAKLENIFLTSLHWDNIGGLPGACLTAQEMGNAGLTVHGPYGSVIIFFFLVFDSYLEKYYD